LCDVEGFLGQRQREGELALADVHQAEHARGLRRASGARVDRLGDAQALLGVRPRLVEVASGEPDRSNVPRHIGGATYSRLDLLQDLLRLTEVPKCLVELPAAGRYGARHSAWRDAAQADARTGHSGLHLKQPAAAPNAQGTWPITGLLTGAPPMLKGAQRSEANHEPNEGDLGPVEVEFGPDRSPHALGPRWYRAACCMQGSQRAEPKASTRRFGDPVPMVSDEKHAARRWERTMCRYKAPTVQPWGSPGHPAPVRCRSHPGTYFEGRAVLVGTLGRT
jgi:hypothetical protein